MTTEKKKLIWLGKWMYNPATKVQVFTDADLGSYYFENKITVGASPTVFLSKKKPKNANDLHESQGQSCDQKNVC